MLALAVAACGGKSDANSSGAAAGGADLTGAGSTFAYPLYSRWASDYAAKAGVKVNYQSIGSGGGIRQLSEQTVDFGATDAPMTDEELAKAKGGPIMHIPTAMGAVVVTYNLPQVTTPLKFTGDVLGDVFLGKITTWNDPRIAALNAGVTLPNTPILVAHRSDGSGTTYTFTDYLSAVSPAWKQQVGKGKDVKWPTGLGGKGNEGVAGQVKQTQGAIGYVELAYARQNKLPVASIRNVGGNFVAPSVETTTAAAAGALAALPANTDYRVSIANAPGANAYPISTMTWMLVYRTPRDSAKGRKLVEFLRWGLADGQRVESALDYAPLPEAMAGRLRQRLDSIQVGGAAAR
ncbi:phosphate-binding protein PstS [Gemmatimonadetes bacterium T265]|nr:phosphate-binding protein PstS [Gemmatimonadetes bacterium T265]